MSQYPGVYPEDFSQALREVYPDWPELFAALDENNLTVGYLLEGPKGKGFMRGDREVVQIEPSQILEMIEEGRIAELKDLAASIVQRKKFHVQWMEIKQRMFGPSQHNIRGGF